MSDLGTARGRVVIDPSGAVRGYGVAKRADDDFHRSADRNARNLRRGGAALAGTGVVIAAGLGVAINAAANFEERISAIGAVSGATGKQLEDIRQKALQLGADTKFSASEAASAMEELVKAGVSVSDIMTGAADATVALAAAGEVDLTKAAEIASAALNNFNLEGRDMGHVADLIAGAANASAIDVEQFGMSLQQSGAAAALVGLSFDDLSTAIALMGNAGIKGSDAGTSLKTMLLNLNPSTAKQRDLMRELGIVTADGANQFFDAEGSVKSFADIAGVLETALAGMTDQQKTAALEVLFGTDAIRAAAVISREGSAGFREMAGAMGEVSATDVAAARMDNFKGSLEQLTGSAETLAIVLGTPFLRVLRTLVDSVTDLTNKFLTLSPTTQKWIGIGLAMAAAVLLIGGTILAAIGWFGGIAASIGMTAGALAGIVATVGIVVVVIALLIAGLVLLYNKNETFRNAVQAAWEWIKTNVVAAIRNVIEGVKALVAAFQGGGTTSDGFVGGMERIGVAARAVAQWVTGTLIPALQRFAGWVTGTAVPTMIRFAGTVQDVLGAAFQWLETNVFPVFVEFGALVTVVAERVISIVQRLAPIFQAAFNIVMIVVQTAMGIIRVVIEAALAIIMRAWELLGDNIIDAVMIAFNFVKSFIEAALDIIRGIIMVVTALIRGDWSAVWEGIKTIASGVWQAIQSIVDLAINTIMLIIRTVLDLIHLAWNTAWTAIHAVITIVWALITAAIRVAIELVSGIISAALSIISTVWFTAWHAVHSVITDVWGLIVDMVQLGIDRVKTKIDDGLQAIKDIWNAVWGGIKDGMGAIWDTITGAVRGGVNLVIDVINWFIRLINNIPGVDIDELGHVGGGGGGGNRPQGGAFASGGITNGPQYLVGEGNRLHKEAVIATDPKYRKQNIGYWMWAGQQLGMMKKGGFLGGFQGGGIIQNVAGALGGASAGFIDDIRRATLTPLFDAAKRMVDMLPVPGGWGPQIKGFGKDILNKVYEFAAGKADEHAFTAVGDMSGGVNAGQTGEAGTVGNAAVAIRQFRQMFPGMSIGGRAPRSNPSDHPEGKALDLMTYNPGIAAQIIRTFMTQAGRKYWIWSRQIASASQGWRTRRYTGPNPHTDHVHLSYFKKGGLMSYLNGGTLMEDIMGIGRSTGRPYQLHGGEHVTSKKDMKAGANGNSSNLNIGTLVIQANTPQEGRAAGKAFLNVLEERKILVDARLP